MNHASNTSAYAPEPCIIREKLNAANITGVVLAGGKGRRMQGMEKGLLIFKGKPIVSYLFEALKPLCGRQCINANRQLATYGSFSDMIITDEKHKDAGPLAGLASALQHASTPYLLTVPCDAPLVTTAMLEALINGLDDTSKAPLACLHDGEQLQPLFMLLHISLKKSLENYLDNGGRKVRDWFFMEHGQVVDAKNFHACFANINTPEELARLVDTDGM